MPKSKEYVSSDEDSSEEEKEVKPKKKQKQKKHSDSEEEQPKSSKKAKKETPAEEEDCWDLGNNRQVKVREFKGKLYVDLREMYFDKDGGLKPGRKGICLSMAQWRKFLDVVDEVDKAVKAKG